MSPESQSLQDCYKWRMECQEKGEKRHRDTLGAIGGLRTEVMGAIGELRDYVAERRGEEAGAAKAEAKAERDKATGAQRPVNGRRSWTTSLGLKVLEWVIMTAIIGGLMYALKNNDKDLAAISGPAPVAKP